MSLWKDNSVQYPRLLAEVWGVITFDQISDLADSMDMPRNKVTELFERAEHEFEDIKERLIADVL